MRRPPCLYVSASQSSRGQVSSRSELRHSRLAAPRRGGLWSRDCQAVVRLRPWRARAARNALRRTRPPTRAQPAFASALYTSRAPPPCPAAGTGGQSRTEPRGRRGQSRGGSWKAGVAFGYDSGSSSAATRHHVGTPLDTPPMPSAWPEIDAPQRDVSKPPPVARPVPSTERCYTRTLFPPSFTLRPPPLVLFFTLRRPVSFSFSSFSLRCVG